MLLDGFCEDTFEIWKFIGTIVMIFKIVIPVILIIIGIIAFGKAVIADDEKEMKSAITKLIKKVLLAVFIFFIPSLIKAVFNLIDYDQKSEATKCINYVVNRSK